MAKDMKDGELSVNKEYFDMSSNENKILKGCLALQDLKNHSSWFGVELGIFIGIINFLLKYLLIYNI